MQHRLNPLHICCRLIEWGFSKKLSLSICKYYEILIYSWLVCLTMVPIRICKFANPTSWRPHQRRSNPSPWPTSREGVAVSWLSNFLKSFAIYDLFLVLLSLSATGLSILGILIYWNHSDRLRIQLHSWVEISFWYCKYYLTYDNGKLSRKTQVPRYLMLWQETSIFGPWE